MQTTDLFHNSVVARVIMKGTHSDSLFNLPPTGKQIEANQINIEEIKDGKILEHWRVTDELELIRQVVATIKSISSLLINGLDMDLLNLRPVIGRTIIKAIMTP